MSAAEYLGKILSVSPSLLEDLDREMSSRTGKKGVLSAVAEENRNLILQTLQKLEVKSEGAEEVRRVLRYTLALHERELAPFLKTIPGDTRLHKAAHLAMQIGNVPSGFFLKKTYAEDILRRRPPEHLLSFLGYSTIEELFKNHDVTEAFSALRFMESDEWMHETFEAAYSRFTPDDFEERAIEIRVLGSEWKEVAAKFVAKKHHNVSHLKEFGVIFLNPINEDIQGKFIRDFALLLHYLHEVDFYAKLFKQYAASPDFPNRLKSLLRGDVGEVGNVGPGEWPIVQRYLFKENPKDPRLFLPRVNPESFHWRKGEFDLVRLGKERADLDLELWQNLDWVADYFHGDDRLVSFDLEDNAMTEVSFVEGKDDPLFYHQREAMWTHLFSEYAGGDLEVERFLLQNFDKGKVVF